MTSQVPLACPGCGEPTRYERVFVTMWLGAELNVIDDVPAHVCKGCGQQYYDESVENQIRALVAEGFPAHKAVHRISVPVFRFEEERAAPDAVSVARQLQNSREVPQS